MQIFNLIRGGEDDIPEALHGTFSTLEKAKEYAAQYIEAENKERVENEEEPEPAPEWEEIPESMIDVQFGICGPAWRDTASNYIGFRIEEYELDPVFKAT